MMSSKPFQLLPMVGIRDRLKKLRKGKNLEFSQKTYISPSFKKMTKTELFSQKVLQGKRHACFILVEQGHSIAKVQEILKMSRSWVKKWSKRQDPQDLPRSGRPKKLTQEQEEKVIDSLLESKNRKLKESAKGTGEEAHSNICHNDQERLLKIMKLPTSRGLFKPKLTSLHEEKRLAFVNKYCQAKFNGIERKMLFYDESYIWLVDRPKGVWITGDSKAGSRVSRRYTAKVMVASFISYNGKGPLVIFQQR